MKVVTAIVLALVSVSAFAQDKVLGPLGPTTNFKRIVDGPNIYVVLDDPGKQIHTLVKGKLVPADPKNDPGKNLFIVLAPFAASKCESGDLYWRHRKGSDPKTPIDENWYKASGPDPKVGALITSHTPDELEGACFTISK